MRYIYTWTRQNLQDELLGCRPPVTSCQGTSSRIAGVITHEEWRTAVSPVIGNVARVHLGCRIVTATPAADQPTVKFDIRAVGCLVPGSALGPGNPGGPTFRQLTIPPVEACLLLVEPTGSASAFAAQEEQDLGASSEPTRVDSAVDLVPGTWYVGTCP